MLVNTDITPDRDLYFIGAKVIESLLNKEEDVDYFELFKSVNKQLDISMNIFILVLDWLFIIGVVKNSKKGFIKKCF